MRVSILQIYVDPPASTSPVADGAIQNQLWNQDYDEGLDTKIVNLSWLELKINKFDEVNKN